MIFPLIFSPGESPGLVVHDALVIGGVTVGGRRPTPDDAIVDQLTAGSFTFPRAGDSVKFHGVSHRWRELAVDKDGWFNDPALENGYLAVRIDEPSECDLILNVRGDLMAYLNGEPRAGDPYSTGYLNLPVHLRQGANELLLLAGRGRISIQLKPLEKPVLLQAEDACVPDLIRGAPGPLWASVVALNGTNRFVDHLSIVASLPNSKPLESSCAAIAPHSIRKLVFRIPAWGGGSNGREPLRLQLLRSGKPIDSGTLDLEVKQPDQLQKRTFLSAVDGSIQYFAVLPAKRPSPSNALVLSLHGAGVEAMGQAAAYAQKDWATIVTPTNRRPYGFDWEGIGRLDALEVLDLAKREFPHDPARVELTGHSMGGHGTWSIGTMEPGLFAAIAPTAGWISFWSYAGGWNPPGSSPELELLRRSMNGGDTLGRVRNTLSEQVYILHGQADDNVPVEQARTMRQALEQINHPALQYHEQPGAGHWWGSECVDWPPLFSMFEKARLDAHPKHIEFVTQNPVQASRDRWVSVEEQETALSPSRIVVDRGEHSIIVSTENIAQFSLEEDVHLPAVIDGQKAPALPSSRYSYRRVKGVWQLAIRRSDWKSAARGSGFKQVFNHRFLFVVGTTGSADENRWALSRAIYDSELMTYRGNATVDVVLDHQFKVSDFGGRNVILFGNSRTNSQWAGLLGRFPPQLTLLPPGMGELAVYPRTGEKECLVGVIGGSDLEGMRLTDRLPLFSSGVDYPDWVVFSQTALQHVAADGFFDNAWNLSSGAPSLSAASRGR